MKLSKTNLHILIVLPLTLGTTGVLGSPEQHLMDAERSTTWESPARVTGPSRGYIKTPGQGPQLWQALQNKTFTISRNAPTRLVFVTSDDANSPTEQSSDGVPSLPTSQVQTEVIYSSDAEQIALPSSDLQDSPQ